MEVPDNVMSLAVCRRLVEGKTLPGMVAGFRCRICNVELQASPEMAERIEKSRRTGKPLEVMCQPCGIGMSQRAQAAGVKVNSAASPQALQSLRKTDPDAIEYMLNQEITCMKCGKRIAKGDALNPHVC